MNLFFVKNPITDFYYDKISWRLLQENREANLRNTLKSRGKSSTMAYFAFCLLLKTKSNRIFLHGLTLCKISRVNNSIRFLRPTMHL